MSLSDFYIDYESDVPNFGEELKAEVKNRLRDLSNKHTVMVGAAVAVNAPVTSETPFLYQARVVVYARPKDVAAVKKDETIQGALKAALSAVERQIREKREKLGEPWKRNDL
jgi:ribosome-associated translation inhibitor RaiA